MAHVTSAALSNPFTPAINVATAVFKAVAGFFGTLARVQERIGEIHSLNEVSDAALEARGLTRQGEIRRIFEV